MQKILAAFVILALGATTVSGNECETKNTTSHIYETMVCTQVVNCSAGRFGVSSFRDLAKLDIQAVRVAVEAMHTKALADFHLSQQREAALAILDPLKEAIIATYRDALSTVTLVNPHAIDFKPQISRYECSATVLIDVQKLKNTIRMAFLSALISGSSTESKLILATVQDGKLQETKMIVGVALGQLEGQLEGQLGHLSQPKQLRYSVQNTLNGIFIDADYASVFK